MKNRFKHGINYGAVILAMGSFLIGTLLLLCYKIIAVSPILVLGYWYTYLAAILNLIMLIILVLNAIINYKDYKENLLTIVILLANIPITLWYMEIVF